VKGPHLSTATSGTAFRLPRPAEGMLGTSLNASACITFQQIHGTNRVNSSRRTFAEGGTQTVLRQPTMSAPYRQTPNEVAGGLRSRRTKRK
jgi:hypothetical protein